MNNEKREFDYIKYPIVEVISDYKIKDKGIWMRPEEFNSTIKPKLLFIDQVHIGWQNLPDFKCIYVDIYASQGHRTLDKTPCLCCFYVYYDYRLWTENSITSCIELVDAIRRYELKRIAKREAQEKKYAKSNKLKAA